METLIDRPLAPVLSRAADVPVNSAFGMDVQFMISSMATNGQLSITSQLVSPGAGAPLHVHRNEDEVFLIVDGRFEFILGDDRKEMTAGDMVFVPRGLPHTFRNVAETPSRFFVVATGAKFDEFLIQWNGLMARDVPDFAGAAELSERYGITIFPPTND